MRSLRRSHKERMKRKAASIRPFFEDAFKLADHLAYCSCDMCCNLRRSGYNKQKLTREELFHEIKYYEEIDNLDYKVKIKNRKKVK